MPSFRTGSRPLLSWAAVLAWLLPRWWWWRVSHLSHTYFSNCFAHVSIFLFCESIYFGEESTAGKLVLERNWNSDIKNLKNNWSYIDFCRMWICQRAAMYLFSAFSPDHDRQSNFTHVVTNSCRVQKFQNIFAYWYLLYIYF